jgi:(E)-4-hydroxy-3-methylbut-2-enyl-diphosphate synthase
MTSYPELNSVVYNNAGFKTDTITGEIKKTGGSADLIIVKNCPEIIPENVFLVLPYRIWSDKREIDRIYPLFSPETFQDNTYISGKLNLLLTGSHFNIEYLRNPDPETVLVMFTFNPEKEKYATDYFLNALEENNLSHNIVLNPVFSENNLEDLQIKASSLLGRYILDRRVTGISITNTGDIDLKDVTALAFSILQCTETRITRTIYLSCPTCGRTKFNLQESVKKVKEATGHLTGLKIAIMGCIVNGPGEMAGADYGYVGTADGKVHIYRGTVPVLKNVPEKDAVTELLKVIQNDQANL